MSTAMKDLAALRPRVSQWHTDLIYIEESDPQRNSGGTTKMRAETQQRQMQLLDAADASNSDLSSYMQQQLRLDDRDLSAVPDLPRSKGHIEVVTVSELTRLPIVAEERIATKLISQGVTRQQAADPAYWTLCHIRWIKDQAFGSDIRQALMQYKGDENSENLVRAFFRHISGLPRARGNLSVVTDCYVSQAWWRYSTALETSEHLAARGVKCSLKGIHGSLHHYQNAWEDFAQWRLKRVASLCSPSASAAVLHAFIKKHPAGSSVKNSSARRAMRGAMYQVALLGHTHNLDVVPWDKLLATAEKGMQNGYSR